MKRQNSNGNSFSMPKKGITNEGKFELTNQKPVANQLGRNPSSVGRKTFLSV